MSDQTMKVGELARRTGLSVRTLHHYDEIGLLPPARRTPSGHRLYGTAEVRRLQQIASLRHLGLPLEEIRSCLTRPENTLERTLTLHLERLREEADRQRRLITLLEGLRRRLAAAEDVSVEEFTGAVEETIRLVRYYTSEQMETLARRAEELGPREISRAEREWAALFEGLGEAMRRGADPSDPPVQELARQAEALIGRFTGGDEGIRASLTRMFREEGGESLIARHGSGLPAGLWEFYGRALAVRRSAARS